MSTPGSTASMPQLQTSVANRKDQAWLKAQSPGPDLVMPLLFHLSQMCAGAHLGLA